MTTSFFPKPAIDLTLRLREALDSLDYHKQSHNTSKSQYHDRLSWELEYINNASLTPYIAFVTELTDYARTQGIIVGPGRGSAPSSLVLYLLGVTQIDPITAGLIVERWFSDPVIEIDVEWSRRTELVDHLRNRYGDEYMAHVTTYRRDKSSGQILSREIHAACFAVSSKPIADTFPTWATADGRLVIDSERDTVEQQGIAVIDLLGMKELSVLAEDSSNTDHQSANFLTGSIPDDDATTIEIFRTANTDGVFLFASSAMKQLLPQAQPTNRSNILSLNAAYRPAFMQDGTTQELVRRMREQTNSPQPANTQFPESALADIAPVQDVLRDTFGLLLFQEQFIEIVHQLTGWNYLESELYRRRAESNADSPQFQDEFIEQVTDRFTLNAMHEESLRRMIHRSRHTYLKAHAEAYVQIAWQMAALKARSPDGFDLAIHRVFTEPS